MKTFRVASWIFTKSLRFYTGGFGTLLQNGACLVGAVLLFIHYIDEKAVVQIIIRADLVLIAPHRYSLRLHKAQRYCWSYCENPLILDTPTNTVGPRNALNYVLSSSRNHVLRHKTRKIPPQVFAIFLAFPTFALLSAEKSRNFFQGAKRCLLAPCPFCAIFSWKIIAKTFGGNGKSP